AVHLRRIRDLHEHAIETVRGQRLPERTHRLVRSHVRTHDLGDDVDPDLPRRSNLRRQVRDPALLVREAHDQQSPRIAAPCPARFRSPRDPARPRRRQRPAIQDPAVSRFQHPYLPIRSSTRDPTRCPAPGPSRQSNTVRGPVMTRVPPNGHNDGGNAPGFLACSGGYRAARIQQWHTYAVLPQVGSRRRVRPAPPRGNRHNWLSLWYLDIILARSAARVISLTGL